jgi:putative hydrolase of the HAD superfamily
MKAPFLLFDLDDTLYPASSGVLKEVNRRIGVFCADFFGIDEDEANRMRQGTHVRYGTTLQWLRICHGMKDPEPYIEAIHPVNIEDFVRPDPALRDFLSRIRNDYVLFTNSPLEHANRTLKALGLHDLFPRIWDLRRLGYRGKPHREAFHRVLGDLGLAPQEAILIDDSTVNIDGFRRMGGGVLPVHELDSTAWTSRLTELLDACS